MVAIGFYIDPSYCLPPTLLFFAVGGAGAGGSKKARPRRSRGRAFKMAGAGGVHRLGGC